RLPTMATASPSIRMKTGKALSLALIGDMATSDSETVWQFYAGWPKTRRQSLARRRTAGNRFFAAAKSKRKKFYFENERARTA
ncbi:hypothetical protein, partial [Mesorhizobium sp.]|uniref:hypothetical protein n=1 Tax=Mesorhizobium sp. TaxID=1871066 RepID=UPI0025DB814B